MLRHHVPSRGAPHRTRSRLQPWFVNDVHVCWHHDSPLAEQGCRCISALGHSRSSACRLCGLPACLCLSPSLDGSLRVPAGGVSLHAGMVATGCTSVAGWGPFSVRTASNHLRRVASRWSDRVVSLLQVPSSSIFSEPNVSPCLGALVRCLGRDGWSKG